MPAISKRYILWSRSTRAGFRRERNEGEYRSIAAAIAAAKRMRVRLAEIETVYRLLRGKRPKRARKK